MHQGRDETLSPWLFGAGTLAAALAGALVARSIRRPRMSFRNKTVLITGGSRGLGLELARRFAREGSNVVIAARTVETLERARTELQRLAPSIVAIACDVRNPEDVERTIETTMRRFGRLDVLINNAGVIQVGPFDSMTMQDFTDAMETHAWGSLHTILAAVPHMRAIASGRIVNVVSIGGKLGVPHLLPYVMSKFAQAGLSEALSTELASDGILVTTVYPGLMRTGSHVNAGFKGKNKKEFAWFSIGAGLPVFSMDAVRAARQIVEACRNGDSNVVLTPAARLGSIASALSPSAVNKSFRVMNRLLPSNTPLADTTSHLGWDSSSAWAPSPLTVLADRAIKRNNEQRVSA